MIHTPDHSPRLCRSGQPPATSRLAVLALLLAAQLSVPGIAFGSASPQDKKFSLEQLLERARAQERVLLARLEEPVRLTIQALDHARDQRSEARAKQELLSLGPQSAPLLLPYLSLDSETNAGQRRRSDTIADALRTWGAPGITEELIAMALGEDEAASRYAIRILPRVSNLKRAREVMSELLAGAINAKRRNASKGLLELLQRGDQASLAPLRGLLFEEDTVLLSVGLQALSEARDASAEEHVRRIAQQPKKALQVLPGILAFYRAVEQAPREPIALSLVRSVAQSGLDLPQQRALLELTASLKPSLGRELKSAFAPLLGASDPDLQDEARLCLALLGDRSARRELLRKYDDWVKSRSNWPSAYEDRAAIEVRLGEYADAAKDSQTGINLRQARSMEVPRERFIELARARCLDGKFRQASKALEKAYLSAKQLRVLKEDPDFSGLVEHSRYGKLFGK